jgi:NADH:ubiquinone oxidoreductase subunit 3 (subunit A)
MFEYNIILRFIFLIILFTNIIVGLGFFFNRFFSKTSSEKHSAYECGFDTFSLNPIIKNFEIDFLLIALLFLIFDLEIIFLIPWILFYNIVGFGGYLIALSLLLLLLFGFFIEYLRGVLNWNKVLKR